MTKTDESIDQQVLALLVKVGNKRKEIEKAKVKPAWKTSCSFGRDPNSTQDRINIQTVQQPRKLVEIYAFLTTQQGELQQAAQELGLEFDGTWQNYSINDWKEDLKTQAGRLSIEKKQKELEALDARVNGLVTPEQRRKMELKALQEILD